MRRKRVVILVGSPFLATFIASGCNTSDAILGSGPERDAEANGSELRDLSPLDSGGGVDREVHEGSAVRALEGGKDSYADRVADVTQDSGTSLSEASDSCPGGSNSICSIDDWDGLSTAHAVPTWLKGAKLGITMQFVVATVPAYGGSDFFSQEYCNAPFATWIAQNYPTTSPLSGGPWGYKDLIPLFTISQWNQPLDAGAATTAASWAALFKASGATFVNATAQSSDRFALWDSSEPVSIGGAGTWNAAKMGPKRDVVGELSTAVRGVGLKFGVNNSVMYGYSVAYCGPNGTTPGDVGPNTLASVSDLYDPNYALLYGPPNPGCGVGAADGQCNPEKSFCDDWLYRAEELVDKYQLDDAWFDWDGATVANSPCMIDKLAFALHYYQTAAARGQAVQIISRGGVFPDMDNTAAGANVAMQDFLSIPAGSGVPSSPWLVDETVSSDGSGCYVSTMTYKSPSEIVADLDAINAQGGTMLLNISPMSDGTIPQEQIDILNALGMHLGAQ